MLNKIDLDSSLPALLSLRNLYKSYESSGLSTDVLRNITLDIAQGEYLAIVGKSGSGKTTLINLMAGIDRPDSGTIVMQQQSIVGLKENALAHWRGRNIGIVFQFFQLLPSLSIQENIVLPMDFCRQVPRAKRAARALELLDRVGIADQAHKLPGALSGGQQQRAAIARALANDPPLLIADEPTGNLDSLTSDLVMQLFVELAGAGKTIVTVSHERDISRYAHRLITLADGEIVATVAETL